MRETETETETEAATGTERQRERGREGARERESVCVREQCLDKSLLGNPTSDLHVCLTVGPYVSLTCVSNSWAVCVSQVPANRGLGD